MSAETNGAPRWVKIFAIAAAFLALLVAILLITGLGGNHGPGRHLSSSEARAPEAAP